jgi:hypothetical protein
MPSYGSSERVPLAPSSSSSSSSSSSPSSNLNTFPGEGRSSGNDPNSIAVVGDGSTFKDNRDCCGSVSTNCARRMLAYVGALNGAAIMMVGIATGLGWVHACPECNNGCSPEPGAVCDTSCCYCSITDLIIPIYTCFLGGILVIAELRLPLINALCKDNFGFMFSLTFRVLYLLFIGSFGFAIKCQRYKYYVGWAAGIFSFGNAFLSCFVMNQHPGFIHLSGHETYAETADNAPFGGNKLASSRGLDQAPVATVAGARSNGGGGGGSGGGGGGGGGSSGGGGWGGNANTVYAPPKQQQQTPASAFGSTDPYASASQPVKALPAQQEQGNPSGFDANPFA